MTVWSLSCLSCLACFSRVADSLPLAVAEPEEDVSLLPKVLNSKFKALDVDSALRPTIINVAKEWRKRSYKTILSEVEDRVLSPEDLDAEKVKVETHSECTC